MALEIVICPCCGVRQEIEVRIPELDLYRKGGLTIDKAMPNLAEKDREAIMSGLCADCYVDPEENWEDDGQPSEYEEWQDVYGGDDYPEQWEYDDCF